MGLIKMSKQLRYRIIIINNNFGRKRQQSKLNSTIDRHERLGWVLKNIHYKFLTTLLIFKVRGIDE